MYSVKAAVLGAVMAVSIGAGTALAQSVPPVRKEVRDLRRDQRDVVRDKHEIRSDRRDLGADRRDLRKDVRAGDSSEVKRDVREVRRDRVDLRRDRREIVGDKRRSRIVARSVGRSRRNRRSGVEGGASRAVFTQQQDLRHTQACAIQPRGVYGASASKSPIVRARTAQRRDTSVEAAGADTIFGMQQATRPPTDQSTIPDRS